MIETAKRTDALVSTLFPSNVKQQLLENAAKKREADATMFKKNRNKGWEYDGDVEGLPNNNNEPMIHTPKRRLKSFLQPGDGIDGLLDIHDSEPIADLFPNASVMFADIAGEYCIVMKACSDASAGLLTSFLFYLGRLHCLELGA